MAPPPAASLSSEDLKAIGTASDSFQEQMIAILSRQAAASHATGQIIAANRLGVGVDMHMVSDSSTAYSKVYGEQLVEKGGVTIQGKFTPWVKDFDVEQRGSIQQIISDGIKNGTPVGIKQSGNGNYPKGSIADQLSGYFDERKSHASTVARTEVGRIQNQGKAVQYRKHKITKVKVRDGNSHGSDEECNDRNGQIWTLDRAEEFGMCHPNGSFDFSPYYGDEQAVDEDGDLVDEGGDNGGEDDDE
jgi:SPP1 gp7 family putative phage head morphogenesis protein